MDTKIIQPENDEPKADDSLENPASGSVVEPENPTVIEEGGDLQPIGGSPKKPAQKDSLFKRLWHHGSIYLLAFGLLFVVALVVLIALYEQNKRATQKPEATIKSQSLSPSALEQLADTNGIQVGDAKQILNVQSNAVFAGTALVKGDLQVGGNIRTGGNLNLTGLTVAGPGTFQKVQAQDLAVQGKGTFTGQLAAQGGLTIAGPGNFSGPVTTPTLNANSLQLAGNLVLNNHIQAGGARPSASGANALGSGGTTNISGSDTAGSITINTGGSPSAGCFTNVRFAKGFASPRVIVTPVGGAAGGLSWYVNRDPNGFSICTNSPAPSSQTFGFDYFVVD